MAYYYDRTTGLPRTPRPLKKAKEETVCVNGKKASEFDHDIFVPSSNTLRFGAHEPGIRYYEVVTPTVKQVAQNHFNCNRMNGLRLENQPTSNGKFVMFILYLSTFKYLLSVPPFFIVDCFGGHWEGKF